MLDFRQAVQRHGSRWRQACPTLSKFFFPTRPHRTVSSHADVGCSQSRCTSRAACEHSGGSRRRHAVAAATRVRGSTSGERHGRPVWCPSEQAQEEDVVTLSGLSCRSIQEHDNSSFPMPARRDQKDSVLSCCAFLRDSNCWV